MITSDDIRHAATVLAGVAHRTPVLTSRTLDGLLEASIHLKVESFQRTGSFKFRGAYTKMKAAMLEHADDFVAFSTGNHAQAVACAGQLLGARTTVLIPSDAPEIKRSAAEGYGARVVTYDRRTDDREHLATTMSTETGMVIIPPFDDPLIMAGQGTVALELLEDVEKIDVLVVPVGGGGLIAGCSTAAKSLLPNVRIVGVEPEANNDTKLSLEAGRRLEMRMPGTVADGIQSLAPGKLTFEVNRRNVDEVVLVSDQEIIDAMAFLFDRLKIVTEPAGAVGVAALLHGRIDVEGSRVGVIISGGNVGSRRFSRLISGSR